MFFNKFNVFFNLQEPITIVKFNKNLFLLFRHLLFSKLIDPLKVLSLPFIIYFSTIQSLNYTCG
jgi:hypothetical protein